MPEAKSRENCRERGEDEQQSKQLKQTKFKKIDDA